MKQFFFLQFFLITNFAFLHGQISPEEKLFTIPLSTNLSNHKSIGLKEIASSIEYIKLEYKPESALGRIQRLVASEKYLFIYDGREISQFSRSGKYIRKIGKEGRGPGEYPGLRDFAVDETTQHLLVLANFIRQIFVYDFNGNYVKSIKLNEEERGTIDVTEDGLIILQTHQLTKSLLSTEVLNLQGISVLKFYSRCYLNSKLIKIAKSPNISYNYNSYVLFKEGVNDTIYKISTNRIIPYFAYDLGIYQPPVNYPYAERGKYIEIYRICESNKFIITFFLDKGLIGTAVYNKTTKKTTINMPEDKSKNGVENDIDNGINYFMATVPFTLKSNQKEWLQILEPNLLNDNKNNKSITGNFKTIIDNFNDGDNPVIMVIRLK